MVLIISFVNYEILIRLMYMQKKKNPPFFFLILYFDNSRLPSDRRL